MTNDRTGPVAGAARIERVSVDDVEQVAALAAEIWYRHYPAIITRAQIEYMLKQRYDPVLVRAELGRRDLWWDKLVVDEVLSGFSSYWLADSAREINLDKIYVHQRWQRRGYGGMLIARVTEVARQQDCSRIVLAVNKSNRTAIDAYLKHGFHVADAIVKEIGGGFVMDDYIMEKPIAGGAGRPEAYQRGL